MLKICVSKRFQIRPFLGYFFWRCVILYTLSLIFLWNFLFWAHGSNHLEFLMDHVLKSRLPQPSPALSKYLAEAGEEETAMKTPASRPAPTHFKNEGAASSVEAAAATGSNSRCSMTSAGASSPASAARCNGD